MISFANGVKKYDIDCDLMFGHLQTALTRGQLSELNATYEQGCAKGMADDLELIAKENIGDYLETDIYQGALLNRKNMHVHALDLCLGQAQVVQKLGGRIFENSEVTHIEHGERPIVRTKTGSVRAQKILLAGNAYHLLERKKTERQTVPGFLGQYGDRAHVANGCRSHQSTSACCV